MTRKRTRYTSAQPRAATRNSEERSVSTSKPSACRDAADRLRLRKPVRICRRPRPAIRNHELGLALHSANTCAFALTMAMTSRLATRDPSASTSHLPRLRLLPPADLSPWTYERVQARLIAGRCTGIYLPTPYLLSKYLQLQLAAAPRTDSRGCGNSISMYTPNPAPGESTPQARLVVSPAASRISLG